jgi:hypothetical protein
MWRLFLVSHQGPPMWRSSAVLPPSGVVMLGLDAE